VLLHKSLKYVNSAIALLIVAALVAVYWYAWRPLPETSGTLPARVSAPATVTRDALGVPHIRAASVEDLIYAQGYVTAQDRLWQMDANRRYTAGQLAEVLGQAGVSSDRDMRQLRLRRIADESVSRLPAADRAVLAAYARGVNDFIESHRNRLPVEFSLLRYDPRPWTVGDSVLVGLMMVHDLTTSWRDELRKMELTRVGDRALVDELFAPRSGAEAQPGSNAWAVSGSRTRSGKPLLSNDMHLEISVPSIWYMAHLTAPGVDVSGVTVPGMPCVIVGHNRRIAWGITNLQADVQDLYLEKIDPQTGRYVYQGRNEQARPERDVIAVRDAKPIPVTYWITRHGPLVLEDNKNYYALRWFIADEGMFQFPFLDINRASNWQEFTAALSRMPGPGSNLVYADVEGNIGYHAVGRVPIRKDSTGDLPADGSTGAQEWAGYIPFEDLPSAFNPPSGAIVTANQNPFPANYRYPLNGNFAAPYRANRIRQLLEARRDWSAPEMLGVQKDVYSAFSHFLARQAVAAYDRAQPRPQAVTEAVGLLRGWNGQMLAGDAQPLLASLLYDQLKAAFGERAAPGKGPNYRFSMAPAIIEKLLRERPARWFADYDKLLLKCLDDAVAQAGRMQGRNPSRWNYGRTQQWTLAHPIVSRVPLVGGWFNVGPAPMNGSGQTVNQLHNKLGPSMRMTVDLGNLDGSLLNLPVGQSGQVLSSHFTDQWKAYYNATSYPMQFLKVEGRKTLVLEPRR
jgi:penicillin amidase